MVFQAGFVPGQIIGKKWELLEDTTLFWPAGYGKGGFGIVWKARNRRIFNRTQKVVALKFPADNRDIRTEAQRQARLAGHPHVVRIFAVHRYNGLHFIEMELMTGGSLDVRLHREGKLAVDEAVWIACQILHALRDAHRQNIIHGDVKPHNILFDANGIAKLADFGQAKDLGDRSRSYTGTGTRAYKAPEQAQYVNPSVSRKSDVWAVGVVLYQMLTGGLPFANEAEIIATPVPALPSSIPQDIADAVYSALEKAEHARLTADELLARLKPTSRAVVVPEPRSPGAVTALHPPIGVRRRQPLPVGWWTALSRRDLLIAGTGALTIGALVRNRKRLWPDPVARYSAVNPKDEAEMVLIPAGDFTMGSEQIESAKPAHSVSLAPFYIYKTPVTVKQYLAFCRETGYPPPPAPKFDPDWRQLDHPIVNVTWQDAQAYCRWAGVRLPTSAEWEKVARGTDGRSYPWGNEWDASRCANSVGANKLSGTMPVGSYVAGASPYDVLDMAGNVWQWCQDEATGDETTGNETGRGQNLSRHNVLHILRGGAWSYTQPLSFQSAFADRNGAEYISDANGFRCAAGVENVDR